jgi:dihydrofolate reductase
MAKLRFNITMSLDGYVAGPGQSLENPLGEGGLGLHEWAAATRSFRTVHGMDGGETGLDDDHAASWNANIGATIMGRNMFGPVRGPWGDDPWTGWWGDTPPFHTPVLVLTHHDRPSFTLSDTTFHFIDATPAEALQRAKQVANGKDVRLGGGVATVREFLDADLVDTMHIAVAPIDLERGERLWTSSDELLDRFHLESVPSPSGVTHLVFWHR